MEYIRNIEFRNTFCGKCWIVLVMQNDGLHQEVGNDDLNLKCQLFESLK